MEKVLQVSRTKNVVPAKLTEEGFSFEKQKTQEAASIQRSAVQEIRTLAHHLQSIREEEKIRIARELHDEFGHSLTALKMDLSWLENGIANTPHIPRPLMLEKIRSMANLVDATISLMREIVSELRPSVLDDLGLTAAMEWQASEFENRTGIKCHFQSGEEDLDLGKDLNTALFRVFQEVMTNVARHANAKNVEIHLEKNDDLFEAKISDDGTGIPEEKISHPKSFGLMGMRERMLLLGGKIEIAGRPEKGTTVRVTIPCHQACGGNL